VDARGGSTDASSGSGGRDAAEAAPDSVRWQESAVVVAPLGKRPRRALMSTTLVLYAVERASWGRGLATEAARAALTYGFDEAGLLRIVAVKRPEHMRSRHVLQKLGMRHERDVDVFGIHAVLSALGRDAFRTPR
jgi:GNAT acetyltransferase-like protein